MKKKLWRSYYLLLIGKGKGKATPVQAWTGPEGSRRLRLPDLITSAHEGDNLYPPRNIPGTHFR